MINKYIKTSTFYVAKIQNEVVGIIGISKINDNLNEIVNIAVKLEYQNKGVGKKLIKHVIQKSKKDNIREIEIGTGNSSLGQLSLYQKIDFRMKKIEVNYFSQNYTQKIFENGIECLDEIILRLKLDQEPTA